MLSNNQQKYLRSLSQKKFREKHEVYIVEGAKIACEVVKNAPSSIKNIFATESWLQEYGKSINVDNQLITEVSERDLKKISNLKTPNQVLLVIEKEKQGFQKEKLNDAFVLYLDNIQDPGNLGTIWRIADWFGLPYILCSTGCVDWSNQKVIQASMGAFLRVSVLQMDFSTLQETCPEVPTYAAVLGGENLFEVDFLKSGVLVIGNESKGVSKEIQQLVTTKITIPKGKNGGAESLNAAVATGIICGQILGLRR